MRWGAQFAWRINRVFYRQKTADSQKTEDSRQQTAKRRERREKRKERTGVVKGVQFAWRMTRVNRVYSLVSTADRVSTMVEFTSVVRQTKELRHGWHGK
jgi:hypothetical protein